MKDPRMKTLDQRERATYQSLRARGVTHEDAIEDALDGVDVEDVRAGRFLFDGIPVWTDPLIPSGHVGIIGADGTMRVVKLEDEQ